MNIDQGPSTVRQFVAHPPFWGSKVASMTGPAQKSNPGKTYLVYVAEILAFSVVLGALWIGLQALAKDGSESVQRLVGYGFIGGLLVLLFGGVWLSTWWSRRKKIVLSVTGDGLTVNTRVGEVYPFHDAKLGNWGVTGGMSMGLALHLHSGTSRFVLGGRDRRVGSGTRLDAPDVGYGLPIDVDAWLDAPEFEEVLVAFGRRCGLDVRPPAPGGPTRCLLFANPLLVQEISSWKVGKQREFLESTTRARLAVDVSPDALRVIDANTGQVFAAVAPAHVRVAPVTFQPSSWHLFPSAGNVMSDYATRHWSRMSGLHLSVPGMAPLSIGCRDTDSGLDHRFSWASGIPEENGRADYIVSGADWQTLVGTFGLANYLCS